MAELEIGGNEYKREGSEGIANIPNNKTFFIERLTEEQEMTPKLVTGLETTKDVFDYFNPTSKVSFENAEGQTINETLHFTGVGDFSIKKMTEQSPFLNGLDVESNFYNSAVMQLRNNKVLGRVVNDPDFKQRVLDVLMQCSEELETEVKPEN